MMSTMTNHLPNKITLLPDNVEGRAARRRARADHDAVMRAALAMTGRSVAGLTAGGIDDRCWRDLLAAADEDGWIDTALLITIVRTHRARMTTDVTSEIGYERLGRYIPTIVAAELSAGCPLNVDRIVELGVPRSAARRWVARSVGMTDGFEIADSRDDFADVDAEPTADVLDRLGLTGAARSWAESVLDDDDRFVDTPAGTVRVWRSRARDQIERGEASGPE